MRRRWAGDGDHLRAPLLSADQPYAEIGLVRWTGPISDSDPDANFKVDVAAYAHVDPLPTITNLADALDVPVGAVVHYVLARWASAGSETLLELGPSAARELFEIADVPTDAEPAHQVAALGVLRERLAWLVIPLDDPRRVFDPGPGGPFRGEDLS